jgi:hypothetical protein
VIARFRADDRVSHQSIDWLLQQFRANCSVLLLHIHLAAKEGDPMNTKRAQIALTVLSCWLIFSPAAAHAISLANLFLGDTITADDKLFRDWTLIDTQLVNGGVADYAQVNVTPLTDDPLNPGVKFTAPVGTLGTPFAHNGPSSVRVVFSFNVQTTNGLPLIKDNSLLLNGWIFDAGPLATIQVSEEVFDVAGNKIGDKVTLARPSDPPGSGKLATANFAPQSFVHVVKTINIQGPGSNDGAFLTMFEQRFSQVPEPATLALATLLMFAGLARELWCRAR